MRPIEDEMIATEHVWRHRRSWLFAAVFSFAASGPLAQGAIAQSAEGTWLTDAGPRQAKVEISECGRGALCSKIVWLKQPNDSRGKPHRDVLNTDDSLRGRPILGMPVLSNLQKSGDRSWQGNVYNPEDGKTYKAHFTLIGKDRAQLKGCAMFGMACREKIWTRTEPEKPKHVAKPKEKPKPVEPAPEAQPEQNEAAVSPPPLQSQPPAPAQSDEVPAELWMDPAAIEQQPSNQPKPESPPLRSSIDPAVPNAPTLDAPQQPQLQGAAIDRLAPAQDPQPQPQPAAVPVPEQKPEVQPQPEAQPEPESKPQVVKAKPKPKARQRRQAQPRKKEVLPWLVQ